MNAYNLKERLRSTLIDKVMTKELITVNEDETMAVVEQLLSDNNINHVPVVDKHFELLGILTKNDVQLLKDWGTNLNLRTSVKYNDQIFNSRTAKDQMNKNVVTVEPHETIEKCVAIFMSNTFHALPVVENNKLVGIITTFDLINFAYL